MAASKACHNCRRRRLRCDKSIPACNKCHSTGQECLGYGQLFRWTTPVSSRVDAPATAARPASTALIRRGEEYDQRGKESRHLPKKQYCQIGRHDEFTAWPPSTIAIPLLDPIFQDLDKQSRYYMNYFTSRLCQDLVVHDRDNNVTNPFRELVPMSATHVFLRYIMTAASAIHYSMGARHAPYPGQATAAADALVDALRARHLAIKSLQQVLEREQRREQGVGGEGSMAAADPSEKDALFATIVFFINFTLIDSGKNDWRGHMEAAGRFILGQEPAPMLCSEEQASVLSTIDYAPSKKYLPGDLSKAEEDQPSTDLACSNVGNKYIDSSGQLRPLSARDYLASDFISYHIWASALESLVSSASRSYGQVTSLDIEPAEVLRILNRTEHNSYHSCPAQLFHIIYRVSRVARAISAQPGRCPTESQLDECVGLLHEAQTFDGVAWATRICAHNAAYGVVDDQELPERVYMAATYRATACLFVLLAAPEVQFHIAKLSKKSLEFTQSSVDGSSEEVSLPYMPGTSDFATVILQSLSRIPSTSPLFKYTTWPVFMAGVETRDPARRTWTLNRLHAMWDICPWGMLQSAMDTLTDIWQLRDLYGRGVDGPQLLDAARHIRTTPERPFGVKKENESPPEEDQESKRNESAGGLLHLMGQSPPGLAHSTPTDTSSSEAATTPPSTQDRLFCLPSPGSPGFQEFVRAINNNPNGSRPDDGDTDGSVIDDKWLARLRELNIDCLIV